jgi:hypothetical protein
MRHTTIAVGKANKWPAAYAASVLVSVAAGHKGHDQAILEARLMTVLQRGIDQIAAEQESQA